MFIERGFGRWEVFLKIAKPPEEKRFLGKIRMGFVELFNERFGFSQLVRSQQWMDLGGEHLGIDPKCENFIFERIRQGSVLGSGGGIFGGILGRADFSLALVNRSKRSPGGFASADVICAALRQ